MYDAIVDRDIAATKIGPGLFSQPGKQFEPDLSVRFIMPVYTANYRGERLDQIGAADDADELAVLDDWNTLDPLSL